MSLPLGKDLLEVFKHVVHFVSFDLLLLNLSDLEVIKPPDQRLALGDCHLKEICEILLHIDLIGFGVEDLNLKSHEIESKSFQNDVG